ncbi:MAG: matrixin family metalloprotease [Phycisphaerales bacterium]
MVSMLGGLAGAAEPLRVVLNGETSASERFRFFARDDAGKLVVRPTIGAAQPPRGFEDPRLTAARHVVATHALSMVPMARRLELARTYLTDANSAGAEHESGPWDLYAPVSEQEYTVKLQRIVSRETFFGFRPVHQRMLVSAFDAGMRGEPVAFCFAPGTDPALVAAFNAATFPETPAFQQTGRWNNTATNGGGVGTQGLPITLTYSFVPDGTTIPPGSSFSGGTSTLRAFLTGIYGSEAVWMQIYHDMFASWGDLCGITYVFEPNDDGVSTSSNPGVLGVRGDLRMAGYSLDGNSGVLAYNNFPQNGDMVVDAGDSFYNTTSNNSRRLRNVLFHEHGHGMGQLHVCPSNQTKLMEPFISTAYFGPQLDDILNAQRHYGDDDEPNDAAFTSVALPSPGLATQTRQRLSIDDNADVDFYSISVPGPSRIAVTIRPIGSSYVQGPQTSACDTTGTSLYDPRVVNDLTLAIIAPNQATTLATANVNPAGGIESLELPVAAAGTYYLRVSGGNVDDIQNYDLDYALLPGGVIVTVPNPPGVLTPGVATTFDVEIQTSGDTLVGTPQLFSRSAPGAFSSSNLTLVSGTTWSATLPAMNCAAAPEFYVQAQGAGVGAVTSPVGAPASVYTAIVGTVITFSDDAETDQGWSLGVVGDTATSGIWERGDPNGTSAQPEDDFDDSGTQCFFTGQAAPGQGAGTNDIDGGRTTLLSPVIDLTGATEGTLSFARWYSNVGGQAPGADTFRVDVSSNGGSTWVNARTAGPTTENTGGWIFDTVNLVGLVPLTSQFRVRFIAEDAGQGSLVEAAVDAVMVVARTCTDVPPPNCPADFNGDGNVDPDDLGDYINCFFQIPACPQADFNNDGNVDPDDLGDFINVFFGPAC